MKYEFVEIPETLRKYLNGFKYEELVKLCEASCYLGYMYLTECICKCIADYLKTLDSIEIERLMNNENI